MLSCWCQLFVKNPVITFEKQGSTMWHSLLWTFFSEVSLISWNSKPRERGLTFIFLLELLLLLIFITVVPFWVSLNLYFCAIIKDYLYNNYRNSILMREFFISKIQAGLKWELLTLVLKKLKFLFPKAACFLRHLTLFYSLCTKRCDWPENLCCIPSS